MTNGNYLTRVLYSLRPNAPPHAIVAGVPAKVLKYLFSPKQVEALLRLKWWDLPDETIQTLPFRDIDACIKKLEEIRGEAPATQG